MYCKICQNSIEFFFCGRIFDKYSVKYFHCKCCNFVQTEDPYWLDEAYKSPIQASDTGLLARNIDIAKIVAVLIVLFFRRDGKFVDYAGGRGIFVRLMRDIGFDFEWCDLYAKNLFAEYFDYDKKNADMS